MRTDGRTRGPWSWCGHAAAAVVLSVVLTLASLPLLGGMTVVAAGQANWNLRSPATSPSLRDRASMVYDAALGQLLYFGGFGSAGYSNETWVWDGTNWNKLSPATSPSPRASASMAYDAETQEIVLFGGYNGDSELGDTWVWTGTN